MCRSVVQLFVVRSTMRIQNRIFRRFFCWAALAMSLACSKPDRTPHPFSLSMRAELGRPHGPAQARFASLDQVSGAPGGLLFAADKLQSDIKVFGKEGQLSRTIGTRGKEPGQFREISAIHVAEGRALWVFDDALRRTSAFEFDGALLSVSDYPDKSFRAPKQAIQTASGRLVLLFLPNPEATDVGLADRSTLPLLHEYDLELTVRRQSFAAASKVALPESEGLNPGYLDAQPGRLCQPADGRIVYAPFLYRGRVHSFRAALDGWQDDRVVEAFGWPEETSGIQEGWHKFGYLTMGLFCQPEGGFFIVYLKKAEGRPQLWLDWFDSGYRLDRSGPLQPQPSESSRYEDYGLVFECRDSLGRYIVRDLRSIPKLLVATISSQERVF